MHCQPCAVTSQHARASSTSARVLRRCAGGAAQRLIADGLYNTAFLGDVGVAGATTRVNFPHLNIKHPPVGQMKYDIH